MLPIVPFNQYLSVGIVINRHNGILFQTGAKKKEEKEKNRSRKISTLEIRASKRIEPRREREFVRTWKHEGPMGKEEKRERERDEDRN